MRVPFRLLISLLVVFGCARRETPSSDSFTGAPVILISIDTLRADRLPLYGYKSVETPAIDALARDGIVFDNAWSPCPMTLPSHVSMLTGLLPTTHGVRNNLGFRYDAAKYPSLPQLLKQNGYATGAAVSSYVIRGETGLREAFDFYDDSVDPQPGATFTEYQRGGDVTAKVASKWIEGVAGKPFFLFLHLYEPHVPYTPPEPFRSKYALAYDGEVATSDAIIGTFIADLKQRGLYEKSAIIVTSDHGEGLGDHGEAQHSILLYTEAIRVPLIVKLPANRRAGTRVAGNVALVDLVPTLTTFLGVKNARATDGVNILTTLPDREIYSETIYPYVQLGWSDLRSIVHGPLHYIQSPKPELYDLAKDPRETKDVIAEHRRDAARYRATLEKFPPPTTGNTVISPEEAAKLAALGYVGSVRARPDPKLLPNPKDHIGVVEEIQQAFHLASQGKNPESIRAMRAILKKNPRLVDVRIRLAEVYQETGQVDNAIDAYKEAIAAAGPDLSSDIVANLGFLYFQIGKLDDAENAGKIALNGSPDKARALLSRVAGTRGDLATAERIARELADSPNASPADILLLAEVMQARGNHAEALQLIGRAEARSQIPVYNLDALRGESLARLERHGEAIEAFEREVQKFPGNLSAYSRLAILYFITGNRAASERTLQKMVQANPVPPAYDLARRTRESLR